MLFVFQIYRLPLPLRKIEKLYFNLIKLMNKKNYIAPEIEVLVIEVERGFAFSTDGGGIGGGMDYGDGGIGSEKE